MHWIVKASLSTTGFNTVFAAPAISQDTAAIVIKDLQVRLATDGSDGYAVSGELENTTDQPMSIYAISYEVRGDDRLLDVETLQLGTGQAGFVIQPQQTQVFEERVEPAHAVYTTQPEQLQLKITGIWSDSTYTRQPQWQRIGPNSSHQTVGTESYHWNEAGNVMPQDWESLEN
jgi:hypothetical protein